MPPSLMALAEERRDKSTRGNDSKWVMKRCERKKVLKCQAGKIQLPVLIKKRKVG